MNADASIETFEEVQIAPSAGRLLIWFCVGVAAMFATTALLPHDRYLRFQQLSDTIHFRVKWVYERIHFDPAPIDIAVIGNSRLGAGVNAPEISRLLSERFGRPVSVVNMSTPQEGRDTHFVISKLALQERPELSMIVLSVIEQGPRTGHPAFRHLADPLDVARAPALLNTRYLADLVYLPYRQVSLFAQSAAPELFGRSAEFDALRYLGTELDTTASFRLPGGRLVDREASHPAAELEKAAAARIESIRPPLLPAALADWEFTVERSYTDRILRMAEDRGVQVAFLYLPVYGDHGGIRDRAFYEPRGEILEAEPWIERANSYADYGHLNRVGSAALAQWLANRLAAIWSPRQRGD